MWNQRKEALVMFRICALVRDQLRKELTDGAKHEEVFRHLSEFYRTTSSKMTDAIAAATPAVQMAHLSDVLHNRILVVLGADESIDFPALREFLTKTWPDMDVEGTINPEVKPMFFTQDGKEVCADPNFRVLLEKTGIDYSEVVNPFGSLTPDGGAADDKIIKR